MNSSPIEKHFKRVFEETEKATKELHEFGDRISKEIESGRKLMKERNKNRRLIRNRQQ